MVTEIRKKELIKNIEKLEAYQEIQNEMGRTIAMCIIDRLWGWRSMRKAAAFMPVRES